MAIGSEARDGYTRRQPGFRRASWKVGSGMAAATAFNEAIPASTSSTHGCIKGRAAFSLITETACIGGGTHADSHATGRRTIAGGSAIAPKRRCPIRLIAGMGRRLAVCSSGVAG